MGGNPWCYSAWSAGLYYRLWRIGPDTTHPKLLLDETGRNVYGGEGRGAVGTDDVLFEFHVGSVDLLVHNHPQQRHYRVERDKVTQIDPVALTPRDFVDTWLSDPWEVSARRSDGGNSVKLNQFHKTLGGPGNVGLFEDMPRGNAPADFLRHCLDDPLTWQVRFFPYKERPAIATENPVYFLLRWQKPYQFTMLDIRNGPFTACTQPDPDAEKPRTMFPSP